MAPATEPATSRAEIVRIKGGRLGLRAGAAAGAVIVEPLHLVPPGS